ncbi:hypothetical protein R4K89_11335 [Brachyspira intermedia]|uniref:hypothetical protein n=1 Tax=Brachyspira intermedia TaxID=84377 RepID=UPI0030046736
MKKIIIFLFLFILLFSLFCYAQRENNNTYQNYRLYKYPNYIDYQPKLLGFFFPSEPYSNSNNIFGTNRYKGVSYTNLNKSLPNDPEAVKLWKEWGIMK